VYQGIIREVYKVNQWFTAGTLQYDYRDLKDSSSMKGRWEFDGEIADSSIRDRLKGNSTKNCLKRGSQNPIRYINC
jgi:hypothetical protein